MLIKLNNSRRGFTLVEIMVAVSIFAIVATIATGALVTASEINRKTQAIKVAIDNLNFALDKMVFDIRKGGAYRCSSSNPDTPMPVGVGDSSENNGCGNSTPTPSANSLSVLTFTNCSPVGANCDSDGRSVVVYRYDPGDGTNGTIEFSRDGGNNFVPIVSPSVLVSSLNFNVFYTAANAGVPKVLLRLSGVVLPGTKYATEFNIQTTASSRGN